MTVSERLTNIAIAVCACEARLDGAPTLNDLAVGISQIANELEAFDLEERDGQFPTPRQALALGRMLNQVMRDDQAQRGYAHANVARGGFGCGPDYLTWTLGDGYHGGIDREGRVST